MPSRHSMLDLYNREGTLTAKMRITETANRIYVAIVEASDLLLNF